MDDDLLKSAQAGQRAALEALLAEVEPRIYRFGLRLCRHPQDAEDILQETMLQIAENIETFRRDGQFSTWVYAIARNTCIKKHRRKMGEPSPAAVSEEALDDLASGDADQLRVLEAKESWQSVARGIDSLSDDNREVLLLRDVEGLSAQETADVLGLNLAAMKSRLHRARKQLRAALHALDSHPGCPDIATVFSEHLEGELNPVSCAELEKHLDTCVSCKGICDALRRDLRICQSAPPAAVPPEVQARIREAVDRLPRFRGGI